MACSTCVAGSRQIHPEYAHSHNQAFKQASVRILLLLGIAGTALLAGCGGTAASSTGQGGGTGGGGGTTSSQPTSISVQFTSSSIMPTTVATQVGTGTWTAATLQNGQFTISVPSGTQNYAYAYVCAPYVSANNGTVATNMTQEYIYQQSVQDGTSVTEPSGCYSTPGTQSTNTTTPTTLNVDATAIPNTTSIEMVGTLGGGLILGDSGTTSMNLLSGTSDFIVAAEDANYNPLAVDILRSQTIPGQINGGNPIVLTSVNATSSISVTYQNVPSGWGSPTLLGNFATADGIDIFVTPLQYPVGSVYHAIPTAQLQSGDFYTFYTGVYGQATYSQLAYSVVGSVINTPATSPPTSFAFAAPLPASDAAPTAAALPTFNIGYPGFSDTSLTSTGAYAGMQWPTYLSTNPPQAIYSLVINATSTYLNGAITLTVPDLSAVPGFIVAPSSGTGVGWDAGAYGENYPVVVPAPTNSKYSYAENEGTYTTP